MPPQHVSVALLAPLERRLYPHLSNLGIAIFSELTWGLPFAIIGLVPAAFAALDAARRRYPRAWVEWAALALALGWWICLRGQEFLRRRLGDLGARSPAIDAVETASLVLTFLLAFVLARLLDRPLRRWLGLAAGPSHVAEPHG